MRLLRRGVSALLVVGLVGAVVLAAGRKPESAGSLEQARRAYEQHNYRRALQTAEAVITRTADKAEKLAAQVLRAKCQIRLRMFGAGLESLERLIKANPRLASDSDIQEHLALAARALRRYTQAAQAAEAAADLYLAAGKKADAARMLFSLADVYKATWQWRLEDGKPIWTSPVDRQAGHKTQSRLVRQTYDRIVSLAVDAETSARAMLLKGTFLRNRGWLAQDRAEAAEVFRAAFERWPGTRSAAEALFLFGLLKQEQRDFVAALRAMRRLAEEYADSPLAVRAEAIAKSIVRPTVEIFQPQPVLPQQRLEIAWRCRNVKKITFRAYKVDLFKLVRAFRDPVVVRRRYRPSGQPAAEWSVSIRDDGTHKWHESGQEHAAVSPPMEAGAYVIVASGEASRPDPTQAPPTPAIQTALVSRLAAICKMGQRRGIVFAADPVTGKPAADVEVLVQQWSGPRRLRSKFSTLETNEDGIAELAGDEQGRSGKSVAFYLRRGEDYAVVESGFVGPWWGYNRRFRIYGFTDRPVYRPGQTVHFKQVVWRYVKGKYEPLSNRPIGIVIRDPQNKSVREIQLVTNKLGSANGSFTVAADAPLGVWRIEVKVGKERYQAWMTPGNQFRVEEYKKPEFEVTVAAVNKPRLGQIAKVQIEAKYYYGEPVADAAVSYKVFRRPFHAYWPFKQPYGWYLEDLDRASGRRRFVPGYWRRELVSQGKGRTDAAGTLRLQFAADGFADLDADVVFEIEATVTDASRRAVEGFGQVRAARKPFSIFVRPSRYIYRPADTIRLTISAATIDGQKVDFDGVLAAYRLRREEVKEDDRVEYRYVLGDEVVRRPIRVKDGSAEAKIVLESPGPYRIIVRTSAGDEEVSGRVDLWIAEPKGRFEHYAFGDVELVLDKRLYRMGETIRLLINTRLVGASVLLTSEADELLDWRVVKMDSPSKVLELPVRENMTPNFYLTATLLHDETIFSDQVQVVVAPTHKFLKIDIESDKDAYEPGQRAEFTVRVKDYQQEPLSQVELAALMVDASVYAIQPEYRKQIEKFFYGDLRPQRVRTVGSYGYGAYVGEPGILAAREMAKRAVGAAGAAAADLAAAPYKKPTVRKRFADTALWLAEVQVDQEGRARFSATMPDDLTRWSVQVIGIDGTCRVGEARLDVVTRKRVVARLQRPRFLVAGDRTYITVNAHNYLDAAKNAKIGLKVGDALMIEAIRVGDRQEPIDSAQRGQAETVVEIPAAGEARVDFVCVAVRSGVALLRAWVLTDEASDALEVQLPVKPYGAEQVETYAGRIGADPKVSSWRIGLQVPEAVRPDSVRLQVACTASMADLLVRALPYLIEYPYGCVEQTTSRFLPAVIVTRSLAEWGIDLKSLRRLETEAGEPWQVGVDDRRRRRGIFEASELRKIVSTGLKRLEDMQNSDGGWGWYRAGRSDEYMTAYVAYSLAEAAEADVAVPGRLLDGAIKFLQSRLAAAAGDLRFASARTENTRAWMLFALGRLEPRAIREDGKIRAVLDHLYEVRDDLSDYGRALVALALGQAGQDRRARIVVENFENTAVEDAEAATVFWGSRRGWYHWWQDDVETTAMVLRALLRIGPKHRYADMAANWLIQNRRGSHWYSTKQTALALYALLEYAKRGDQLVPDMRVSINLDGRIAKTSRITKDNLLDHDARLLLTGTDMAPGFHELTVSRQGKGLVDAAVILQYFTKADPIPPQAGQVAVSRRYWLIEQKVVLGEAAQARAGGATDQPARRLTEQRIEIAPGMALASGSIVEVVLTMESKNTYDYIVVEDPKPAGCEPLSRVSGYAWGSGLYGNVEYHDDRTAFLVGRLPRGEHTLRYRLRCVQPGTFVALPCRVYAMYSPHVAASSGSDRLTITDAPADPGRE